MPEWWISVFFFPWFDLLIKLNVYVKPCKLWTVLLIAMFGRYVDIGEVPTQCPSKLQSLLVKWFVVYVVNITNNNNNPNIFICNLYSHLCTIISVFVCVTHIYTTTYLEIYINYASNYDECPDLCTKHIFYVGSSCPNELYFDLCSMFSRDDFFFFVMFSWIWCLSKRWLIINYEKFVKFSLAPCTMNS